MTTTITDRGRASRAHAATQAIHKQAQSFATAVQAMLAPHFDAMPHSLRLSCAQLRALDHHAIATLGLPGVVLMENAGRQAAERILATLRAQNFAGLRGPPPWSAAVVCGPGNNGGDGYVVARHLQLAGCRVECFSACEAARLSGDAAIQRRVVEALGFAVFDVTTAEALERARARWGVDVLVDGLLGTGSSGAPRGAIAAAIEALNATGGPLKVALDLPSGLDADSGVAASPCFVADLTVTFAALKLGFGPASEAFTGTVTVADIGVAPELVAPDGASI